MEPRKRHTHEMTPEMTFAEFVAAITGTVEADPACANWGVEFVTQQGGLGPEWGVVVHVDGAKSAPRFLAARDVRANKVPEYVQLAVKKAVAEALSGREHL